MSTYEERLKAAEQKAAAAAAKVARLKKQARGMDAGQKLLTGAIVIKAASDPAATSIRVWLLKQLEAQDRPADKKRLVGLIEALKTIKAPVPSAPPQTGASAPGQVAKVG